MKKLTNGLVTFLVFVLVMFAIQLITKRTINWVPILIVGAAVSVIFTLATRRVTGFIFIGLAVIGSVFSFIMPQVFPLRVIPLFIIALLYGIYMVARSRKKVVPEK